MDNLTAIEAKVLNAVYEQGEADIHAIHKIVSPETQWKYTTIQTIANTLCKKGYLERKRNGRRFIYKPIVTRTNLFRTILGRFFGMSLHKDPSPLVSYLFEIKKLSHKDQQTLRDILDIDASAEKTD